MKARGVAARDTYLATVPSGRYSTDIMERTSLSDESAYVCVRDRLLNAADRVVGRDGVGNFTLEAVAHEAGVSKGGLLYHFPSKSALIHAVVERLANRCETDQQQCLTDTPDGPGAFTRAYLTARAESPDPQEAPVHTAILAAAGTDPQFLEPFRKKMQDWQDRLEDDGIEPETATIVRLAIDGLCLCRMLGMPLPNEGLRSRIIERLIAMTEPGASTDHQEKRH